VGDPLPTEHQLAASFNVSRSVVREALRHFRTLGIIKASPKTVIRINRLAPDKPFEEFMPYIKSDRKKLEELFQLRLILEIGMIPFLIKNATKDDLDELEYLAWKMKDSDTARRREVDRQFHMRLVKIVGNEMLERIQPHVDYFEMSKTDGFIADKSPDMICREHLDIVEAIKNKEVGDLLDIFMNAHYKEPEDQA
jgi:DNA-binding FadR family transcriptional regulator